MAALVPVKLSDLQKRLGALGIVWQDGKKRGSFVRLHDKKSVPCPRKNGSITIGNGAPGG